MANTSILAAFERMWQHISIALNGKSDTTHNHDGAYATKTELGEVSDKVGDKKVSDQIATAIANKSDTTHTHNYAGSSSAGGAATSANKLNTNAGSTTQPVYFSNGIPVNTTHTLGASVPSNAKFTDTVYTHPSYTSKNSGLYKITVNNTGHVSATTSVSKSDITALGIPAQDTTYSTATTSAAGLMSASDKAKLDNRQEKHTAASATLNASGWSSMTQTVSVSGVTANNTIIATPSAASHAAYGESGVYCSAQANGTLTFTCSETPSANLTVNVLILN